MTNEKVRVDDDTKAAILVEAIPYVRRFQGAVVVVKYGGSALGAGDERDALASFCKDIVLMRSVGMAPVVVHGGGPQIGELMERLGMTPKFVDGHRVTDAETLEIARMVLVGKVNRELVAALNVHAPIAVGVSGEDAGFITADLRDPELGFVGDVAAIDPSILERLVAEGLVPVVATIGMDASGQAYNINADTVAGAVAASMDAEKVVFLTDIDALRRVRDDPGSSISALSPDELDALISSGAIVDGMIPKARACAEAVRAGVRSAHILDGSRPHALLLELFTETGIGTMVREGAKATEQ